VSRIRICEWRQAGGGDQDRVEGTSDLSLQGDDGVAKLARAWQHRAKGGRRSEDMWKM
jgi:hypothetical protein